MNGVGVTRRSANRKSGLKRDDAKRCRTEEQGALAGCQDSQFILQEVTERTEGSAAVLRSSVFSVASC